MEFIEFIFKLIGFLASIIVIIQISRIFFQGSRVRVVNINGSAEKVQKDSGEVDLKTGQFTPEWVYALQFQICVQNDGLRLAPQVRCIYTIDKDRPIRSTSRITLCDNVESIPARQKSDSYIINCRVQGPPPIPVNLDVHIIGLLVPNVGRICRFDAYYFQNSSGGNSCTGNGETLGWIQSDLIRKAASCYNRGFHTLGLWLINKLQLEKSHLEAIDN